MLLTRGAIRQPGKQPLLRHPILLTGMRETPFFAPVQADAGWKKRKTRTTPR